MSRVQRRARAPSLVEDLPRPWRGIRSLSSRAFRARLACARRAEKQAWKTANGVAQALLFRYHRALERDTRIPRRGGAGVAWRGRRQDAGVCLTRWELALWTKEQREIEGGEECRDKWREPREPSARAMVNTCSISPR